ncbi:hypothetical protein [Paenibacillus dendritiformis]|uniref:PepSY domain-containing protein n=1 Tax=Paenibacillus dendritiformis C454 TaxID=1131935 RepID=H3SGH4_9BACL|nr:hypothetical protein [Paenibacillus dendritiformis]EHQ61811.1 hypothetical protein PDENDC454_13145 [Paenibacillus dendritiformis C454]CAH8769050.1 hypothetical protein H7S4_001748 [Paenibacillus dendritiformis]
MNLKKTIVATLIASGMLAALTGPIPAGAEAAQETQQEQQSDSKKVPIDKKLLPKLQKAVKQFAGKEIKLQDVGEFDNEARTVVEVKSEDGNYRAYFEHKSGRIWSVSGNTTIDKIGKKDQDEILKTLKGMHSKKTYAFDKEVVMFAGYDDKKEKLTEHITYQLRGKDFTVSLGSDSGGLQKERFDINIKFEKKELDSKLLKTAAEAVKTALEHEFDVTEAALVYTGARGNSWVLEDDNAMVYVEAKTGKATNFFHHARKQVTTNKVITEKEAKEKVAPIAKKLFNIDISKSEVKWDSLYKDYCFFIENKGTVVRAALDADKNVVYLKSGDNAAHGGDGV